jgi:nucleoside-diphosphate-sugar epimerase
VARTLFLIGGTGFIGREVIAAAGRSGLTVRALARSDASAASLESAGAQPVRGTAENGAAWADALRGTDVLIDLVQPPLPSRLSGKAVKEIVARREAAAAGTASALSSLPAQERPVWFSISGADDLEPDPQRVISHNSALRADVAGFGRIGIPVRRLIERSGLDVTYIYFGVMVYGAGKGFADNYVNGLRQRKTRVIGSGANRLPIVHVIDAAGALVHLSQLPRDQLVGRAFVAADGADTTQRELIDETARLMEIKPPGTAPPWLVGMIAGRAVAEALTFDAHADNSALRATGFSYLYPSYREGVPQALEALGELKSPRTI